MTNPITVACVQTNAAPTIETNLARLAPSIHEARQRGADLIVLPENADHLVTGREKTLAVAFPEDKHPSLPFFSRLAKDTGAWILVGSLAIDEDQDKLANRSYLFNAAGQIVARYDKIHLFDADVGAGESYRESALFRGGDQAVTAETPWGKIGLTICYDLRFPHLYRTLAKAGAQIIVVPAAFTVPTGKLHWHVLLRARAIETGCFIVAPAQCGEHDGGRRTYGHSLIISPQGEIIAEAGDEPTILMATLDLHKVTDARSALPSLKHDRAFETIKR